MTQQLLSARYLAVCQGLSGKDKFPRPRERETHKATIQVIESYGVKSGSLSRALVETGEERLYRRRGWAEVWRMTKSIS